MTSTELKVDRKLLGLTQQQLGDATGYSRRLIQDCELGKRKISKRLEIAVKSLKKQRKNKEKKG